MPERKMEKSENNREFHNPKSNMVFSIESVQGGLVVV